MSLKKCLIIFFVFLIAVATLSCTIKKKGFKFSKNVDIKIALVISGPVNDSLWNKAAYDGLKRFQSENNKVDIAVVERVNLSDSRKVFAELAEKGFNLIIGNGYDYGFILKNLAKKYPETFFCVIGGEVSQESNLCSFSFKDEQYGYLIGVVAGLNTSTNKVGIVVGKNLPSIERTIIGLRRGLKEVNPKADLVVSYINSWNNIAKGREAALAQINTGVDVITHLADISGVGVIKAAEEADISAIGAIVDQHDLAPTTVISSGIEDASQLVFLACAYYVEQILTSSTYRFGLKNQLIDLTPSYGNIDPTTETRINRIKTQLAYAEAEQEEKSKNKKKR